MKREREAVLALARCPIANLDALSPEVKQCNIPDGELDRG
jgi:hypothetical protein